VSRFGYQDLTVVSATVNDSIDRESVHAVER
jgi:hypothetical protein